MKIKVACTLWRQRKEDATSERPAWSTQRLSDLPQLHRKALERKSESERASERAKEQESKRERE